MNRTQAIRLAKQYAADFTIQHAGVTKDNTVVTTTLCIEYQIRNNNLLLSFNGNWSFNGYGWHKSKTIKTVY